ncbi:MAG: hypothetical protein OEV86_12935 [Candidatus Krumholzibacteria bacterium]|nr:hypothetical protein [Candidatus Krumholzibacteria bacterium]
MAIELNVRGATFTSDTLTDFGANARTGMIVQFADSTYGVRDYIIVKAAEAIADGLLVMKDSTSSSTVTVIKTSGVAVAALGVNNTGGTVASGDYFYALRRGLGYADPEAGGWVDGAKIGPAANGEADTVGTVGDVVGVAILDSSATVNANLVLFDFGFGFVAAS